MTDSAARLKLRGTFIDADDPDVVLSPHAHSDPGQSRNRRWFFEDQERYIEQLDEMYQGDSVATGERSIAGIASDCGDTRLHRFSTIQAVAERESSPSRPQASCLAACCEEVEYSGDMINALEGTFTDSHDPLRQSFGQQKDERRSHAQASASVGALRVTGLGSLRLAALEGDWVELDVTSDEEGVWTIKGNGHVLFNGKHFGSHYDVSVHVGASAGIGGAPLALVQRGDGWFIDEASSGVDQLVWRKQGEARCITWARPTSGLNSASRESTTELRSRMLASALKMCQGWNGQGRLCSAMTVVKDISQRICEDMQRAASYIVDNVQSEVKTMSGQIRACTPSAKDFSTNRKGKLVAEKVVKNLEVIPTMVQNLLAARVAKAREQVREHVHGFVEQLSSLTQEGEENYEHFSGNMQNISQEAVAMAGAAIKAAAIECQAHASKQLSFALSAMQDGAVAVGEPAGPSQGSKWVLSDEQQAASWGQAWEVGHDPWRLSRTIEQALAVVQNTGHIPHSLSNQVVADMLLRARIRSGGAAGEEQKAASALQSLGEAAPQQQGPPNVGSRGHPDLCRPCLFHAQGICTKGESCGFCHVPHPKRPVRFDKLHRETLKQMPFGHLAAIMLPVLQQKYDNIKSYLDDDVCQMVNSLWPRMESHAKTGIADGEIVAGGSARGDALREPPTEGGTQGPAAAALLAADSEPGAKLPRKEGSFVSVLQAMGLRSLLATLAPKVPLDAPVLRNLVESILQRIHGYRKGAVATLGLPTAEPVVQTGTGGCRARRIRRAGSGQPQPTLLGNSPCTAAVGRGDKHAGLLQGTTPLQMSHHYGW